MSGGSPESSVNVAGPKPDPLGRASFATFAVSVLSVPIGVVSSVVIARVLGPSAKGSFNLAAATADLISMILGVSGAAGITLAVARGDASPRRLLWVLCGLAAVQIPIAVVLLWAIGGSPLTSAMLPPAWTPLMIGLIAVLVGATSARLYSRCVLIGLRQNVATSWRDLWGQLAAVFVIVAGLALAAVLHHGASPMLILGLTVVGTLLSFVFVVQALLNVDLPRQGGSGLRKVLVYASPVYAFNLVQFLNFRLDVFLVAAFAGARELGLYALAVGLGQLLWITSSSVATVLLPRVASSPPIEGARQAAQLTRITLLIGVAGAAALALIASPLINIVYGQAYAEAVPMLLALLPGIVAYVAVKVLTAYLVGVGRLRITVIVSLIGLIATLVLDFTLIPRLGALGAAIASTVSYSLSAIVTVRWTMKVAGLPARAFLLIQRADLLVFGNAIRRLAQ